MLGPKTRATRAARRKEEDVEKRPKAAARKAETRCLAEAEAAAVAAATSAPSKSAARKASRVADAGLKVIAAENSDGKRMEAAPAPGIEEPASPPPDVVDDELKSGQVSAESTVESQPAAGDAQMKSGQVSAESTMDSQPAPGAESMHAQASECMETTEEAEKQCGHNTRMKALARMAELEMMSGHVATEDYKRLVVLMSKLLQVKDKKIEAVSLRERARSNLILAEFRLREAKKMLHNEQGIVETNEDQRKTLRELEANIHEVQTRIRLKQEKRKALLDKLLDLKGTLRVFLRVCPLKAGAKLGNAFEIDKKDLCKINLHKNDKSMRFDKIFGDKAKQKEIFDEISPLLQSALDGNKVAVFTYGQTGTGKTYTTIGVSNVEDERAGILPRLVQFILKAGRKVKVSVLEVYNETMTDLLNSVGCNAPLELKRDRKDVPYVSNLKSFEVTSTKDFESLMDEFVSKRFVAETKLNKTSSRSHCIVQFTICDENDKNIGGIAIIDLAGSENLKETGVTAVRKEEAREISKSLSSLSRVLRSISTRAKHIPFRDSLLTKVLERFLQGGTKVVMIATIAQHDTAVAQTLHTLDFAVTVKDCNLNEMTSPISRFSGRKVKGSRAACYTKLPAIIEVHKDAENSQAACYTKIAEINIESKDELSQEKLKECQTLGTQDHENQNIILDHPDHGKKHHHLDVNTLNGHTDSVTTLHFSDDGRNLATVCADGAVRIFRIDDTSSKSFKVLRMDLPAGAHPTAVAFSEGSSSVVVAAQALLGSSLYMYADVSAPTAANKQQGKLSPPEIKWSHSKIHGKESVLNFAAARATYGSGDGSTIIISCSEATDIKIWHGKSGKELGTVDTNQLKNNMSDISPNGRFIAAAAFTADVKVWEIVYSKDSSVKEVNKVMQLKGHKSAVTSLCFVPNSEQIITASKDGTIRVWNINVRYHLDEDPKTLRVFAIPLHDSKGSVCQYDHMSISPDGKVLAVTSGSTLQWLCVETGAVLDTAEKAHEDDITGIAWAPQTIPNGGVPVFVLASSGVDKKVKLWLAPEVRSA